MPELGGGNAKCFQMLLMPPPNQHISSFSYTVSYCCKSPLEASWSGILLKQMRAPCRATFMTELRLNQKNGSKPPQTLGIFGLRSGFTLRIEAPMELCCLSPYAIFLFVKKLSFCIQSVAVPRTEGVERHTQTHSLQCYSFFFLCFEST